MFSTLMAGIIKWSYVNVTIIATVFILFVHARIRVKKVKREINKRHSIKHVEINLLQNKYLKTMKPERFFTYYSQFNFWFI